MDGVSFELMYGEICGLVGPNGAGKSTLIKLIMGIEPRNDGEIVFGDDENAIVGYVPERPTFFEDLTAFYNLYYIARLNNLPEPEEISRKMLAEFGLEQRGDDILRTFSKGMKQRLAIARALIHSPKLLVMDEPFSGLDPSMVMELRGHLKRLWGTGLTVLVSSHDLNEIDQVCDSIVFIKSGKIIKKEGFERVDGNVTLQLTVLNPGKNVTNALSGHNIVSVSPDGRTIAIVALRTEVPGILKKVIDSGGQVLESKLVQRKAEDMYADVFLRTETVK
ncbi:MAG: ABC transporter ATP-binding protein [Methanomassiliicoccus sp.]|nr:MAG: ABC transporter ATP-binding protein [Methanomassiliicoccus sp.]